MKELLIKFIWCHLYSLGMFTEKNQTLSNLKIKSGFLNMYNSWLQESIRILEQQDYIHYKEGEVSIKDDIQLNIDEVWDEWDKKKKSWLDNPNLNAQVVLLESTLKYLPEILTGKKLATQIIFPNSSMVMVENVYKNNVIADYFNQALANNVIAYIQERINKDPSVQIRILEIGAGTGATSAIVFKKLKKFEDSIEEYCYTDISKAFLNHAEQAYGMENPYLSYKIFNVENPLVGQNLNAGRFDIVIAANVLHATQNIRNTLRNTKTILKKNGVILLNEITINNLFNHLTFGLLEGWWRYEDYELRIPGCPELSPDTWKKVLESEGFSSITFPCSEAIELGQQIIVAESDGLVRQAQQEGEIKISLVNNITKKQSNLKQGIKNPARKVLTDEKNIDKSNKIVEEYVQKILVNKLSEALRIKASRINIDEPFSNYGLDSIIAVNLTRVINQALNIDLEITIMFEYSTISDLKKYILSQYKDKIFQDIEPSDKQKFAILNENKPNKADQVVEANIEKTLVNKLSEALRIEASRINTDEPFSNYGLDSIIAVNLTRVINQALNIDLEITIMFEYGTINDLKKYILSQYKDKIFQDIKSKGKPNSIENDSGFNDEVKSQISSSIDEKGESHSRINTQILSKQNPIAIVGVSGKFPMANNIKDFWKNIKEGKDCITKVPLDRDDWKEYFNHDFGKIYNIDSKWGGFIDGVYEFDPLFFGIAPKEAELMSPEQRLLLMCIWNTIEDAGVTPKLLSQDTTGVFIATGPSDYQHMKIYPNLMNDSSLAATPSLSMIPNRISYILNLHGPSEYCETACSSSLVALHRAVQSINQGECSQAIVGSVNLLLSPLSYAGLESANLLSLDGKAKPFQNDANGFVRSEGVGAILIKPLQIAIKDNDFIYAVVKGTGVSHGGKGVSLTAPNINGMKSAMIQAYNKANIDPHTVSYIEAHGISSSLADGVEISSLKSGFQEISKSQSQDERFSNNICYISSLKPCIGHGEIFSGMAALIKVILAIRNKIIPSIPQFTKLNENISLEGSPFQIAVENHNWETLIDHDNNIIPRRASINSYGIGGVNAHVVVEEYSSNDKKVNNMNLMSSPEVVVISAKTKERLLVIVKQLLKFIDSSPELYLPGFAYTMQIGREAMDVRLAMVVNTIGELQTDLQEYVKSCELKKVDNCTNIFAGSYDEYNLEIVELFIGNMGDTVMQALLSENKFSKIAQYWVKGANINWKLLHKEAERKIPLPTYPFEQRKCWSDLPYFIGKNHSALMQNSNNLDNSYTSNVDEFVIKIVSSILGLRKEEIRYNNSLEQYGMNSLLIIGMLREIHTVYPQFSLENLQKCNTVQEIIDNLSSANKDKTSSHAQNAVIQTQFPELICLNKVGKGQPVFWIHGGLGGVETFKTIAQRSERTFYGIQARGFMTKHTPLQGIQDMAEYYIRIIKSIQSEGPYDLGGYCLGGILAYEITRQLQNQNQVVNSIVMLDSPDNTGFSKAVVCQDNVVKNAALQVVNMLLWPCSDNDTSMIAEILINNDELDEKLESEAFFDQLVVLAQKHGLSMNKEQLKVFIRQNVNIQISYKLQDYIIQPLPNNSKVNCYYFRNSSELFYGNLECNFKIANDIFSLDHINYWQDWQEQLPNFYMMDIDSPNHMMILNDKKSTCTIGTFCEKLYSIEGKSSIFLKSFTQKNASKVL
ncbi:phosphopantetheine-binding protein [Clostridium tagluense]|uniref:beta-ketoacyl synthase N-terminal-like domain-containing protein n=1 Tax=Clostridium tagluense TaxID=360422 RepID=UPI001CF149D2|nr:beta-ketoacyl synthase N-terminal-like domain-containing protein [Clostridium tagluense]MCB2312714.1 phosphopantetheine-binding protein [Clostridium tagluense]MCB2317481.1 phosphopantetheine-binding protein [Clostridium tagluense]MCB2322288.1 phosphopantetheine-binding protein [Clostridium tagluense]MCB2327292.1 phosphopantetheine-binding protein [Clostridium tagluense]MCB2331982.1 phosphopantetheine-binding protein [Clostridium tagluense]